MLRWHTGVERTKFRQVTVLLTLRKNGSPGGIFMLKHFGSLWERTLQQSSDSEKEYNLTETLYKL